MTLPHHHPHRTDVSLSLLRVSAGQRFSGAIIATNVNDFRATLIAL